MTPKLNFPKAPFLVFYEFLVLIPLILDTVSKWVIYQKQEDVIIGINDKSMHVPKRLVFDKEE